jgi:hypothetical protein
VPGPPARHGFGARLIGHGLARQLQADARLLFIPSGVCCEIDAPLGAVAGEVP